MRRASPFVVLIFPAFGLLMAIIFLLANGGTGTAPPPTPPAVTLPRMPTPVNVSGEALIDFTLPALDGDAITLSGLAGRVVFLNFWATWCEPCRRELPAFVQFNRDHPAPDAPIIVAVNLEETPEQIYQFMAEHGLDLAGLPIALDSDHAVADRYGVFNIPVTYVIDEAGIVRYPSYGELERDEIESYLAALAVPLETSP